MTNLQLLKKLRDSILVSIDTEILEAQTEEETFSMERQVSLADLKKSATDTLAELDLCPALDSGQQILRRMCLSNIAYVELMLNH